MSKEDRYVYGVDIFSFGSGLFPDKVIRVDKTKVLKESEKMLHLEGRLPWYNHSVRVLKENAIYSAEEAVQAWKIQLIREAELLECNAKKLRDRAALSTLPILIEEKMGLKRKMNG